MPSSRRTASVGFVFVAVLLDMLALGTIVPVLPKLFIEFSGGDDARAASAYGVVEAIWAGMQFLAMPLIGALSDRFGRRRVLQLSGCGLALDYAVMALAPTLPWLVAGRIVSGFTSASYATAFAYIADVTPAEQRARKFGILGAAFGLAFIIGPATGGILGGINLRWPFWIAAGLSLLNALWATFVLPESLPPERRSPHFQWRTAHPIGALQFLRARQTLLALAVTGFLYRLAHDAMQSLFVLYTHHRYFWTPRTVGMVLASVGVMTTIVQAGLVGPVVRRIGERLALLAGLIAGAAAYIIYAQAAPGAVFVAGLPRGALFGLAPPSLQGVMWRRAGPSEQGQLQGANASLAGIAGMTAPVLFTQLFATAIGPLRGVGLPGAPFLVAALLLIIAAVIAVRATAGEHEPAGGDLSGAPRGADLRP